jgi:hypothetical protein
VDFCRAWAAALFDDPNAVEFRGLSAQERFTALQSGEVDVLARNSTWTWARDAELGLTFGPVNFYDGQAIMAARILSVIPLPVFPPWRVRTSACRAAPPPSSTWPTSSALQV